MHLATNLELLVMLSFPLLKFFILFRLVVWISFKYNLGCVHCLQLLVEWQSRCLRVLRFIIQNRFPHTMSGSGCACAWASRMKVHTVSSKAGDIELNLVIGWLTDGCPEKFYFVMHHECNFFPS